MPGRDVSIWTPGHQRRRSGLVLGGLVAALGLFALGIALGSRIASSAGPSASPAASAVDPGAAERPSRGLAIPSARSPAGAVAAAASSVTAFDGDVLLDPPRLRAVVSRIASRAARHDLLAAFTMASAQTRAKLGADTAPKPVIVLKSVPAGYRVERFSPDEATVSIWYVGIVGSGATVYPQQSWRTQLVELVWEAGAWKISSFASSPGPTPPLPSDEVGAEPGELFAAIPRFKEFERALP